MSTPAISGLRGTGYKPVISSTKSNDQMDFYNQVRGGTKGGIDAAIQGLTRQAQGDQSYFDEMEAPARREFGQQQSQIASRFSGMGMGGRRSSGHANAQSGAAVDFGERLQSQRVKLQQNAWEQLMGMGTHLFDQNLFETSLVPKKKKWYESLVEGLGGLGGNYLGGKF